MTNPTEPTTPPAPPVSYWQQPSPTPSHEDQLLPQLRARLVALVAALVIQATIALLGGLPALPVRLEQPDVYYSQSASFWVQFAVMEFLAAVVVSLAFGPGIRFGDLPAIARLILGVAFVAVPTAALVLGGIDAAQVARVHSSAAAASSWVATAEAGIMFFGLPLLALAAPRGRAAPNVAA
jgi:hypothetical protein